MPSLLPIASQIAVSARSPLGQIPPTSPCAISQLLIDRLFMSCAFCANSCMIFEHSGQTVSIARSEEHTSELQSLMRISYAVFCLKKKKKIKDTHVGNEQQYAQNKHTTTIPQT